jgi:hypothetical protein
MKAAFLQGQINLAQCPQCGTTFAANVPLLYYDLEKELSLVLVPPDLNVIGSDQEKLIGDLTNSLVNSLPTEERKFYLFNPKQFLSLESMVKTILEADGISEEVLEAQAARAKLIRPNGWRSGKIPSLSGPENSSKRNEQPGESSSRRYRRQNRAARC